MPGKTKSKAEYETALKRQLTDAEYAKLTSLDSIAGPQERPAAAYDGAQLLASKDKSGVKYPVQPLNDRGQTPQQNMAAWEAEYARDPNGWLATPATSGAAQPMSTMDAIRAEQGGPMYQPTPPQGGPQQFAEGMTAGKPMRRLGKVLYDTAHGIPAYVPPPAVDVVASVPGQQDVPDIGPSNVGADQAESRMGDVLAFAPGQKKIIQPWPEPPQMPAPKTYYAAKGK